MVNQSRSKAQPADSDTVTAPAPGDEAIRMMRADIQKQLSAAGIDPRVALAGFDKCKDPDARRKNYEKVLKFAAGQKSLEAPAVQEKIRQIGEALAYQKWSDEEIARALARFGVMDGLMNATPAQIEAIWQKYRAARMF
jgi:hypothetical protein